VAEPVDFLSFHKEFSIMKAKTSEKGQALILIVFAILGLIGLTALAVDGGSAYSNRREAQNTADATALAAAYAKIKGENINSIGLARAASNGFNNDGDTNTVVVRNPPTSGPYSGNSEYVQIVITSHTQTYFGPVVGVDSVTNQVEAVARAKPATVSPMSYGNAVVALKQDDNKTLWLNGNPSVTTIGGGVFVNSSTNCGFTSNGVPDLITPNITMVAAQSCPQMAGTGISYNAAQIPYPPVGLPNPVCTGNAVKTGNTLSPGNVSGNFPPGGVTVLNPGVYCVSGSFMLNGNDTLTGSEVTIVMNSGNIHWNGNGDLHLSAPTSGPFKGLLIYFPMTNSSEIRINGTNDQILTGSILAPASPIVFLGTAGTDGYHTQIVGYTVQFGGTFDGIIRYNDNENYDASVPAQVELTN
jgi:hypothetical protein